MPQPIPKVILFLAANPKNTSQLGLDDEVREIEIGLQRSRYRDQFELKQRWAVSPREMQRSIEDLKPHIVHFSGHGVGEDGLALENEAGDVQLVQAEALAQLFRLFVAPFTDPPVQCVLMNACYSEVQANAIAEHIPYVIGMNKAVGDKAAREFAVGFYDALGAGREIPIAYEFGKVSISMAGIPEHLTPQLVTPKTRKCFKTTEPMNEPVAVVSRKLLATPTRSTVSPTTLPNPIAVVLDMPEGSVSLDSPFYIDRPPIEDECYDTIDRPGALIRIKAPRQMGKSSLMQRVLHHSKQLNQKTACLNFQSADAEYLDNIDLFLQ
jgi:hypothetical protein